MYEITHKDNEKLQEYIAKHIAYEGGIYDFTFEHRFLVYHAPLQDLWHYLVIDMTSDNSSLALRVGKPLMLARDRDFVPFIYDAIKYTGDRRYANNMAADPIDIIDSIFRNVLPEYGFNIREEQIELSKKIFRGFSAYDVSICEAEVGTGKSLAYLIAGVVAKKHLGVNMPVTISTATIELQNALVEKEIPRLSKILMDYDLIDRPLAAIVRKGKEHFFCKFRYNDFVEKLQRNPEKHKKLLAYFSENDYEESAFDLDKLKIPGSVKGKICVKGSCSRCDYRYDCQYYRYIKRDATHYGLDFQVTNHNLYLTSEKLSTFSRSGILKQSDFVIVDEAHKLKEAAVDVYGEKLCEKDIPKHLNMIKTSCENDNKRAEYKQNLARAERLNTKLFALIKDMIREDDPEDGRGSIFPLSDEMIKIMENLEATLETLEMTRANIEGAKGVRSSFILHALDVFTRPSKILTWADTDENGVVTLCCCPNNIGKAMHDHLWSNGHHHILMSGTMSDGKSFDYFEKESGTNQTKKDRKQYSSTPSPFDYQNHTRLYLPEDLPMPAEANDETYVAAIADRIVELVRATNGHTAILFTSYKTLSAVYELAKDKIKEYELICMTRSNKTAISDFKKKDNAVLFASGTMWEGVDCVGDKLSSVIIVRLPFPLRSATMEEKKSASVNVRAFINEYAVPEMLIKLRQGVGRLIRSESDTGLISILDTRATQSAYAERVQSVLAKHPRVDSIEEIKEFFHEIKPKEYFEN